MLKYTVKRILTALPVLLGITVVTYLLISLLPGSPIDYLINSNFTEDMYAERLAALGLDAPWYEQYWIWLTNLLQGNFGNSYLTHEPILTMIGNRIGPTLLLMGTALLLGILVSIPVGILCAVKQNSAFDYVFSSISFLGFSFPAFFLAMAVIFLFSVRLSLLPSSGMYTSVNGRTFGDLCLHLILPAFSIAFAIMGRFVRYIRASVLEELGKDYLRTAAAKGVKPLGRIMIHALRNSLLSIVTLIGMEIPTLFSGAVIVEKIFSWPGIGSLMSSSITNRDYPVLMGLILISAVVVVAANLLTDIVYALVDPRIRLK